MTSKNPNQSHNTEKAGPNRMPQQGAGDSPEGNGLERAEEIGREPARN